jgi:predicted flap endonuclease-1-like 5' DNA nuclease
VRLEDEAAHKEFMKKEEEKRKADEKAVAEKTIADAKSAEPGVSSSSSSKAKMTPEEISRMVEGYDLTKPK